MSAQPPATAGVSDAADDERAPGLNPIAHFQVKMQAMHWAMATATAGENSLLILDRAMAYEAFVTEHFAAIQRKPAAAQSTSKHLN